MPGNGNGYGIGNGNGPPITPGQPPVSPPGQAPVSQNDQFITDEDSLFFGSLFADNGFGGDEDPNGDVFFVAEIDGNALVSGQPIMISSSDGRLTEFTVLSDGSFSFVSTADFQDLAFGQSDAFTFTYLIVDEKGFQSETPATATITVNGTNDAPMVALALSETAAEGDAFFVIDLLDSASDPDNGETATLTAQNISGLTAGVVAVGSTLEVDPSNPSFQSLDVGESQIITVSYEIVDVHGDFVTQTATITITGTYDAPVCDEIIVPEGVNFKGLPGDTCVYKDSDSFAVSGDFGVVRTTSSLDYADYGFDGEGLSVTVMEASTLFGSDTLEVMGRAVASGDATSINLEDPAKSFYLQFGNDTIILHSGGAAGEAQKASGVTSSEWHCGDDTIMIGSGYAFGDFGLFYTKTGSLNCGDDILDASGFSGEIFSGSVELTGDVLALFAARSGSLILFGDDTLIAGDSGSDLYGDTAQLNGVSFDATINFGDDTLVSGAGSDEMWGDLKRNDGNVPIIGGADTFVFATNSGADTIGDFEIGKDTIDLSAVGISGLDDPAIAIGANANGDVIIDLDVLDTGVNTVTLLGVTDPNALTTGDFIFS